MGEIKPKQVQFLEPSERDLSPMKRTNNGQSQMGESEQTSPRNNQSYLEHARKMSRRSLYEHSPVESKPIKQINHPSQIIKPSENSVSQVTPEVQPDEAPDTVRTDFYLQLDQMSKDISIFAGHLMNRKPFFQQTYEESQIRKKLEQERHRAKQERDYQVYLMN